jgi:hypothetical protein
MTSPYLFYFVLVPRENSNLSEVRFGEVAVLKQILVLHHKNSWKFSEYLFDLQFLLNMPQVISKISLVLHFLIWATKNPRKNWSLSAVLFWQISATICVCLSIAFFFSSFDHKTFGEIATVVYALYVVFLSWNLNRKGLIHYYVYTNVANRIVLSFVWRKFSSVGIGEWWDEVKNGQKLKLGDAHAPQEISKRYKRQSLGMPRGTPSSSAKIRSPFKTLYFYCVMHYAFLFERLYFSFQFSLVLFAAINGWTPTNFFWRRLLVFICQEHSVFHSYRSTSVLFFYNCV